MSIGYVAMLDVLGFSDLLARDGEGDHLEKYLAHLGVALNDTVVGPPVDSVVFSDSIVLTTKDNSEAELHALLLRCSRAFGLLLQNGIALRGAIAHGPFYRNVTPSGTFVAGRAILDAYNFERLQDWVGIMIAPSTLKQARSFIEQVSNFMDLQAGNADNLKRIREITPVAAFVQRCNGIPFQPTHPLGNRTFEGYAIVPTDGVSNVNSIVQSFDLSYKALEGLRAIAPTPEAQAKYQRSSQWMSQILWRWRDIAHWEKRLEEEAQGN